MRQWHHQNHPGFCRLAMSGWAWQKLGWAGKNCMRTQGNSRGQGSGLKITQATQAGILTSTFCHLDPVIRETISAPSWEIIDNDALGWKIYSLHHIFSPDPHKVPLRASWPINQADWDEDTYHWCIYVWLKYEVKATLGDLEKHNTCDTYTYLQGGFWGPSTQMHWGIQDMPALRSGTENWTQTVFNKLWIHYTQS
jgi:hypothetical protein